MKLETAETLALLLMKRHGLIAKGWTFEFDRATRRLGATHPAKKKITLSRLVTEAATASIVEQVMLHEIAHALLPAHVQHGHEWKTLAAKIGYTGKRTMANPYLDKLRKTTPKGRTTQNRRPQVRVISQSYPDLAHGTVLTLPNGKDVEIFKSARSRYHAKDSNGVVWTIPFGYAKRLVKA